MDQLPLKGIRVVDTSRVLAMPYAASFLSDLGAEVIKVEACHIPDTRTQVYALPDNEAGEAFWERSGTFHTLNRGKRSLTLDLRSSEALAILKELVRVSDIFIENYTPRVTRRFGLDYTNLRNLRADIIAVSNTGYGHSGPWSPYGAVAATLESTHGTGAYMGYDGVPAKIGNSYSDFLAAWTVLFAVMAALIHRARTGRGLWVDLAMYQVGAAFMGEGLLDFAWNGRRQRPLGNRHDSMAPHGCYPCRGDDQWVVLAVRDEQEWQALCRAIGRGDLAGDPRLADAPSRQKNQDLLDAAIAEWTRGLDKFDVMHRLQGVGIPCGPVMNGRDLLTDPHLKARGFFERVSHPEETGVGTRTYGSRGWRFSAMKPHIQGPGPILGEANSYVLREILGLDEATVQRLEREKVIGNRPVDVKAPQPLSLEQQKQLGWIKDYDPGFRDHLDRE